MRSAATPWRARRAGATCGGSFSSRRPSGTAAGAQGAGFTGYLVKPVRAASLEAQLIGARLRRGMRHRCRYARRAASAAPRKALDVLVAEDNEINALLTRALLARLGHRPSVADERRGGGRKPGTPRATAGTLTIWC